MTYMPLLNFTSGRPAEAAKLLPEFVRVGKTVTLRGQPMLVTEIRYEYEEGHNRDQLSVNLVGAKDVDAFFGDRGLPSRTLYWEGNLERQRPVVFSYTYSCNPVPDAEVMLQDITAVRDIIASGINLIPEQIIRSGALERVSQAMIGQKAVFECDDLGKIEAGVSTIAIDPSNAKEKPHHPEVIVACFVDRPGSVSSRRISLDQVRMT